MTDPLQQARDAAANARIADQQEPDWRRVRWALERYLEAAEDLNLLVHELEEMDPGDDTDGGAGWPSPTTPKPTLSGKDAKTYPPVDSADG